MKLTFSILCLLFPLCCYSQTEWGWAKNTGIGNIPGVFNFWGMGTASGARVSHCKNGDLLVSGLFADSLQTPTGTLYSNGNLDAVVARFTSTGQMLWARTAGGLDDDWAVGAVEDKAGNIFIAGRFTDSIDFSGHKLYSQDTSYFHSDIFFAKYTASGGIIWAKRYGSVMYDGAYDIQIDQRTGNIVVGGIFGQEFIPSSAMLSCQFGSYTLTTPNGGGIFLISCDTSGDVRWAKKATGYYNINLQSISIDSASNIYISGVNSADQVFFDSIQIINPLPYRQSIYVAKYDSTGKVLWANGERGNSVDQSHTVTVDKYEYVYTSGQINSGYSDFGNGITISAPLVDDLRVYIAKYTPGGRIIWAKEAGISQESINYCQGRLLTDADANLYMVGTFKSESIFKNDTVQSAGVDDIMVCKYDSSGAPVWFAHAGSAGRDEGTYMSMDAAGSIYVTGVISGPTAKFGNYNVTNASSKFSIFLAKLVQYPVGIGPVPGAGKASIYPNPSSGYFTVSWPAVNHYTKAVILNNLGQPVATQAISASATECSFLQPALADGVYYAGLCNAQGVTFTKLIIRH